MSNTKDGTVSQVGNYMYDFDPDDCEMLYEGNDSTIAAMGVEGFWYLIGPVYHKETRPMRLRQALVSERNMVRLAMDMFEMCMIEARHVEPEWVGTDTSYYNVFHQDPETGEWYARYIAAPETDDLCNCGNDKGSVDQCPLNKWYESARKAKELVNGHFGKTYIR